jgi:hypothetical protein
MTRKEENMMTLAEFEALEAQRKRDPLMAALMAIGEAVAAAGFIDGVGGSEWRRKHDPALPEGTFRLDGPCGELARTVADRQARPGSE